MQEQLSRLAKNTVIYGIGGVLNRFIGFLLLPLFTAYLTPTDYGVSGILAMVAVVATNVFLLGIGAGLGICYYEGNSADRKEAAVWTAMRLLVPSAAVLAVVGIVFPREISQLAFGSPEYAYYTQLSVCTTAVSILITPLVLRLQFEERAVAFVILGTGTTLVSIGFSLVAVVVWKGGIKGLLEAGLAAQVVSLLAYASVVLRGITLRTERGLTAKLLRVSVPFIPSFVFLFIMQQSNRYVLQYYHGLSEVGIYSIGSSFGMVMALLVGAFSSAWYPYFMSFLERKDEARRTFGRVFTIYVIGFGFLQTLFYVAARPAVLLMTRPAFHNAFSVIGVCATAQFAWGLYSLLLPGVYFSKETASINLTQAVAAIATLTLSFVLIPGWGANGAAWAMALGALSLSVFQHLWNLYRRKDYLQVAYNWRPVVCFGVMASVSAMLLTRERAWSLPIECGVAAASVVLLLPAHYFLLGSEERLLLRAFLASKLHLLFRKLSGVSESDKTADKALGAHSSTR
ncbi:MAG TPA: oligosaccharide flippase family protein [Planctomycetota bacterium]|jgi:O-antigen/teichoic acid export membrane protein